MYNKLNRVLCVDCFNFKVHTVTIAGTKEDFKSLPFKIQKALENSNSVKVYRCVVDQLTCEVYIENKTIHKRLNKSCKKVISMGRIK